MSENNFSKDYANLRPLYSSRYGNSRIFTANYNGKKVIVKALKQEYIDDAACKESLRQEYETTSMLENKYIRRALDFVQIEGLGDCIIFEYIDGKSLAEHVRVGTLSEKQVKSILTEVCDGLTYLHRNGLVHCNLNPENILVTANGYRSKLIDLGIPETKQDADRELLIKEMEFVAPEIIKGEDYDSRADIYSLGKIMEFIGERNISKQFGAVATHCTQFSKEQRFDNISDVRSAISKGHSFVKIIILVLLAAALGVLAFIYVPKIKNNVEQERSERLKHDFEREVKEIRDATDDLCNKYALKSLDESTTFDWSEDSLKYADRLRRFLSMDEYKDEALNLLREQRTAIEDHRMDNFVERLLSTFKNANDIKADSMRRALGPNPSDSLMLIEANKWYGLRY